VRLTRARFAALLVPLLVPVLAACAAGAGTPAPPLAEAELLSVFPTGLRVRDGGSFGLDRARVLPAENPRFARLLRVDYPAGSGSQRSADVEGTPAGGAQAYLLAPTPADEAYLRYYVRFPDGFDFVKGGKLPGLFGGTATAGRRIPDGTDGFSTRYMWRRGGDGEVYAYLPTSREHGTSIGRGAWRFVPGRWTSLEQRVRLNRPGVADGRITVWVDDVQVLDERGVRFRTSPAVRIDGVFLSTFFGGGDESWATPEDQHADFAGFALSSAPIGPD
jgi:hypothetical protein